MYSYTGTAYIGGFEYNVSKTKYQGYGGVWIYSDVFNPGKIYTPEGYIDNLSATLSPIVSNGVRYNYFRKDHLGNIREVWNGVRKNYSNQVKEAASTRQRTQYYPSGLPWAESFGAAVQKNKYNDKEFIEMHGLDEYDSEARWYYPAIMRTTTIDPLAEKFYDISPYVWCLNNPVRTIDPDGRFAFVIAPIIPAIPGAVAAVKTGLALAGVYFGAKTAYEVATVIKENKSSSESSTQSAKSVEHIPNFGNQQRNQEKNASQWEANQVKGHNEMVATGAPNPQSDGSSNPKGDPNERLNLVQKISIGIASSVIIGANLINPNPSKDALESLKNKISDANKETNKTEENNNHGKAEINKSNKERE